MKVQTVNFKKKDASISFTNSLQKTGFSILKKHPIDLNLINDVYAEWNNFFSKKNKYKYLFNKKTQDGFFPFQS